MIKFLDFSVMGCIIENVMYGSFSKKKVLLKKGGGRSKKNED